jgi:hypothetical protein
MKRALAPELAIRAGGKSEPLVAAIGMAVLYAIFLSRFDLRLLFTDTILTGGDSASWLQPLERLKNDYLPHLRLFGYSQSNFFGYLEGQHYFILPFLSAALLGYLMPLTVALKIVTFAGCAALPATVYFALGSISGSRKTGLIGAAGSLAFLFNESYSMFGGNLLSTFAGEFCYSWAIALLPLYIAAVWKDHERKRCGALSGVLLGLIGLCHLFVFMPAFFMPFFFMFDRDNLGIPRKDRSSGKRSAEPGASSSGSAFLAQRILSTCLIALLVMAFWFLPMAATRIWAQSISMIWHFESLADFARQTLMPVWLSAALFLATVAALSRGAARRKSLFVLYGFGACAVMFTVAKFLEIPDIRFVPPLLVFSIFALSLCADSLMSKLRGPYAATVANAVLVCTLVASGIAVQVLSRNSPAWFAWNYSGYEAKQGWKDLEAIARRYRGDMASGRMLWEKQNQRDNADFGSERGFENLYMLTGLPSAEGIHYGSSFMARAVTYLQSEYSPDPVDPEAWRLYSRVNPEAWPLRFSQVNAHYIIAHSPEITAIFAGRTDFELEFKSGKFSVFAYRRFPSSYVEVLENRDIGVVDDSPAGFRTDFYRFYRDYELVRKPFVPSSFAKRAAAELKDAKAWFDYDELRDSLAGSDAWRTYALAPTSGKITGEREDNFRISFDTDSPGKAHIVKMSYAPGWRSKGGEKILPVSPGFMLLYPKTRHVDLVYSRTLPEIAGIILSCLLPLAILFAVRISRKELRHRVAIFRILVALYIVIVGGLVAISVFGSSRMLADIQRARGLDLSQPSARKTALALVEPYTKKISLEKNDNLLGFEGFRIKAAALTYEGKREEAREIVALLRNRYSHCRALDSLPSP